MRAVVIVLFLTIVSSFSLSVLQDVETEWSQFKADYGKIYKSIFEEQDRKAIFVENYKLIKEHNKKYELGFETYTLKLNKFADTTSSERKILRGFRKTKKLFNSVKFQPNPLAELPESLNWTSKGVVTRVKNQGDCGSCWAFSATGSVESQYFLKTGKLVELSEQNLIDCSTENNGCNGGFPENAMYYILKNDGIDSEEFYPYKTMNDYCGYDSAYNVTSISGVVAIESGNEEHLKQAVVTIGPISVGIDASSSAFAFYEDGVFNPKQCDNRTLDHAVLVVGYGSEDGREYWLVKNSWSEKWGYNGYIKMIRNNNNHCGIATDAVYPTMY